MKVVLFALNGSWSHTNLAIRCLRAPLEREGFCVTLVEQTLHDRTAHVLERLWREDAEVYGFSCYIWNLSAQLELARELHKLRPAARILLGGPEVSFATERFDGLDFVDTVVAGEGEEAVVELCRRVREGVPLPRVLHAAPMPVMPGEGILYRNGEGGSTLYYESSRGCPFRCAYCLSSATEGVRFKSVAKTLADLEAFEALEGSFHIIKFVDRSFNADVRRANEIWRALLDDRFTRHYQFEVCASLLNEESFEILSRFPKGKIQLEFGLQSTNPETLAASARQIDPARVIAAVKRIYEMGNIHVHLDLIAGLPYESYTRFAKSFDDAYGCCDLLQLGFLKLLHGTELRARMEEYGYKCLSEPPYTVLENRWISYPELQKLSRIAEVLERVLESGRFSHALYYLTPRMRSPFAFWEGLCDHLAEVDGRPLQKRSQPEIYRAFFDYAAELDGVDREALREMLAADFSQHEHKNPPAFLRASSNEMKNEE